MLNAGRALSLNADSGRELPRVDAFQALYDKGFAPRCGQVIMIAGRSGTQKSGLALFWVDEMALPTLYFSADMNAFTASSRLASKRAHMTTDEVEKAMLHNEETRDRVLAQVADSKITFSFGSPITWWQVDQEIEAYVELWGTYPEVMVFDNLMDFDGAESDYTEQMAAMSNLTDLARDTGSTILVLHHATDKSHGAVYDPAKPPSRDQVKNGLAEKPECSLTVAIENRTNEYRIAVVKQRMGKSDPSANDYAILQAEPWYTRFVRRGEHTAPGLSRSA